MRAAAKMSLLQVKQWAKSAEARGRPCGRSSRAARVSPPAPTNVTFTLFAAMTGSPLSLLSFRMAARLRGRDKPGGRLRCRIAGGNPRSEEHTSELQSLMRNSYAVFCLKKKNKELNTIQTLTSIMKR